MNLAETHILFCLPTMQVGGGLKVLQRQMGWLTRQGAQIDVICMDQGQAAAPDGVRNLATARLQDLAVCEYDFLIVSHAFLLPMVLPLVPAAAQTRVVFFCQDYEAFFHAATPSLAAYLQDSPALQAIFRLPVPMVTTSRAVQTLIRDRVGSGSHYISLGIDRQLFYPRARPARQAPRRVLMVGNYLHPFKGMRDGLLALQSLSGDIELELVVISGEERGRDFFNACDFRIEFHHRAPDEKVPEIMASCHAYLCCSFYEGVGLPGLEAFCCGVPVVSTDNFGVHDYGLDETNMLIIPANDPTAMANGLRRILLDDRLAEQLRHNAFKAVDGNFTWEESHRRFAAALETIGRAPIERPDLPQDCLQELLRNLEAEGVFTPIEVLKDHRELSSRLDRTLWGICDQEGCLGNYLTEVEEIRTSVRTRLTHPETEYHDSFKTLYDLCQLVIGLRDNPRVREYLKLLLEKKQHNGKTNSTTFLEIKY